MRDENRERKNNKMKMEAAIKCINKNTNKIEHIIC